MKRRRPSLLLFLIGLPLLACSLVEQAGLRAAPSALPPTARPSQAAAPTIPTLAPTAEDPGPDMDRIQGQVSAIRGLYPTRSLDREILPSQAVRQKVLDDFFADYTRDDAREDAQVLALLGLLEPGFDLWTLYVNLYEEQVAGYYDPTTARMFVVGDDWGGAERLTYAHEYVHALQDQHYDLQDGLGYNDVACEANAERCAALSALIEGDATLAEEQWWRSYATDQDFQDLSAAIAEYGGEVFDSAPRYLQRDFLFPYDEGLAFVQSLFRKGGWAAVDGAYKNPPTTTEQILHPERYGKDEPVEVLDPIPTDALGPRWRRIDEAVLGEWFTSLVLDEYIPEWEAADAAAGWGGDRYVAYYDDAGDEGALVLLTVWDTPRDAYEFVEALLEYGSLRFGEPRTEAADQRWTWSSGAITLDRAYDQTLWIVAPDAATAVALRDAAAFPQRP